MTESPSTNDVAHMLSMGIAATERREYESALHLLKNLYEVVPPEKYPLGLSSYGLCIAKVTGKNKSAAELCQKAITLQNYEGKHWANLVRVYALAKNQPKALETYQKGVKLLPKDAALIRVRDEMGWGEVPPIRFLSREHPLNKLLKNSKIFKGRGRAITLTLAGLFYAGVIFMIFYLIIK